MNSVAIYKIITREGAEHFIGKYGQTKEQAIAGWVEFERSDRYSDYYNKEPALIESDIIEIDKTGEGVALDVYIDCIREADHDLHNAFILANSKGYNALCDWQDAWNLATVLA